MLRKFILVKDLPLRLSQVRFLNLQEYQSKTLLEKKGCNVQSFFVAENVNEAEQNLKNFTHDEYVVKAQILAGGRGKGRFINGPPNFGGVYITKKKDDVIKSVKEMIGKKLVTKQTDPSGVMVNKVMVAESIGIKRETYLAILMDRDSHGPVVIASPAGGMDIEEIAEKHPELIHKTPIDINTGISDNDAKKIAKFLEFPDSLIPTVAEQVKRLYELFLEVDATQLEINPLAETKDERVFAVDAKINFDDSAAYRQKDIFAMDNHEGQNPREVEAKKYHLNYIGMDGNIACLVNGAGLAMATMDIIKHFGGTPANFLDVGGAVTEDQVLRAFQIICSDEKVKGILVNIFGGIVNCETIATGIIQACKRIKLHVPLIVRLEGTNVDAAKKALKDSGLPFITASNLEEAAQRAVAAINSESNSEKAT
uniref:Succinate--CoA ligase [GDP-forming] subunit beta, mitochondrial n=1 Tax=Panagrolaimus sp. ES5 TaxID=591445 RepID=A0AC34GNQ8_9BILA